MGPRQRIQPGVPVQVQNGEKVSTARCRSSSRSRRTAAGRLSSRTSVSWAGRPLFEVEAWRLNVQVPDRDDPGVMRTLLDDVSFKALPGDMINNTY